MADIFLSTPSARRATACVRVSRVRAYISIHALREEGDVRFNTAILLYVKFLSTPSARRATQMSNTAYQRAVISIHALREEGDE